MDGAATWNLSSAIPHAQPENQVYGRSLCELGFANVLLAGCTFVQFAIQTKTGNEIMNRCGKIEDKRGLFLCIYES